MTTFTRRQLIGAVAAGAASASSTIVADAAHADVVSKSADTVGEPGATTAGGTTAAIALQSSTAVAFSPDYATRFEFTVPVGLSFPPGTEAAGAAVTVTLPTALLRWSGSPAVVNEGGHVTTVPVEEQQDGANSRITVTLPEGLGTAEVSVSLPVDVAARYPVENVGDAVAASVSVRTASGTETVLSEATVIAPVSSAWGASVYAAWAVFADVQAESGATYNYPTHIRVVSSGPGAIPANGQVDVFVDDHVVRALSVTSVTVDGTAQQWLGAVAPGARTSLRIPVVVPAGTSIEIALEISDQDDAALATGMVLPRVVFSARSASGVYQRVTGLESNVPVSSSGRPFGADPALSLN
ncbi:hypothetical protein [Curtobacterium sp. 9128]|uniref:hypothetical protein n=1 Tax=Curtobacterium sp. 9128 TaxID=1793722 RepID=UPI00119F187D|nr:hypothetical protein [Curtobacterium sp. 9128]